MTSYAVALDIGTSGFRAQAIDPNEQRTVSTAITIRHPLPGANVIDHVNFAIETGEQESNDLIIQTINRLIRQLKIDPEKVTRMAVCGNPFQLSLFQNIEIRDLAFAGRNKWESLKITPPKRDGDIVSAKEIGLDLSSEAQVYIPPTVGHEIGADALAMLLLTGAMDENGPCIVIDYGTNAEMALVSEGQVYTGSAAAGPALEGQEVLMGMLAAPGAISDIAFSKSGWICHVLDEDFKPKIGDTIDPMTGLVTDQGFMHNRAKGITGTGVIAALAGGMNQSLIVPPAISTGDKKIRLQDGIYLEERDISEAGKAIGAIRAGYLTLIHTAGLKPDDIKTAFMSGATGVYVDARKAQSIGLVPPCAERIVQVGNTSLEMAKNLALNPSLLEDLRDFAKKLRANHCMFATSEDFMNIYSIELSLWSYGMPMSSYNDMLDIYGLAHLPMEQIRPSIIRRMERDIPDLGYLSIHIIDDIGVKLRSTLEGCIECGRCEEECPESAIKIVNEGGRSVAIISSELCAGTACKRCEMVCPNNAINLKASVAE